LAQVRSLTEPPSSLALVRSAPAMNWPDLTPGCTQAIAEILKDVVSNKPKELIDTVATTLEAKSGWNMEEYEKFFEECKHKPRTYVLEALCPPEKDPLAWVPMRYNDDTILCELESQTLNLVSDILSTDPIEDTVAFKDRALRAIPELMYFRDSPQELTAFQTLRAIYLGCSGAAVLPQGLDDADPLLSFRCEALFECFRATLLQAAGKSAELLQAVMVFSVMHILGSHQGFQARFGGNATTPEEVVLHAIDQQNHCLPSFQRLDDASKQLIVKCLHTYFPLRMLIATEAVPAHFQKAKELLVPLGNGLAFQMAVSGVEFLVQYRGELVKSEVADIARMANQCFNSLEKYNASRSYELFLKKRCESHSWRLMKDDYVVRAIVRLCCFAGSEDTDFWNEMLAMYETLSSEQKATLRVELGRKDGLAESPVCVPMGVAAFLRAACANSALNAKPAVLLLATILGDATKLLEVGSMTKVVNLHLDSLIAYARDFRGGMPFEDTAFSLEELGANLTVRIAGAK